MSAGPSSARVQEALAEMGTMRGFPRREDGQAFLTRILLKECADDAHVDKVVDKVTAMDNWPGPAELRRTARDLKPLPAGYQPTAAELQFEEWKAEQAADRNECPAGCVAGMVRGDGPGSPWTRCNCKWAARVTDSEIELENRLEAFARRPAAAGLQPVAAALASGLDELPHIGEQRDRELARKRREMTRERREAEDGGTIQ